MKTLSANKKWVCFKYCEKYDAKNRHICQYFKQFRKNQIKTAKEVDKNLIKKRFGLFSSRNFCRANFFSISDEKNSDKTRKNFRDKNIFFRKKFSFRQSYDKIRFLIYFCHEINLLLLFIFYT